VSMKVKHRMHHNILKANDYPQRSDASTRFHLADETFSSNMLFEAMPQRKSINVLIWGGVQYLRPAMGIPRSVPLLT
jgi:hypothetical protein